MASRSAMNACSRCTFATVPAAPRLPNSSTRSVTGTRASSAAEASASMDSFVASNASRAAFASPDIFRNMPPSDPMTAMAILAGTASAPTVPPRMPNAAAAWEPCWANARRGACPCSSTTNMSVTWKPTFWNTLPISRPWRDDCAMTLFVAATPCSAPSPMPRSAARARCRFGDHLGRVDPQADQAFDLAGVHQRMLLRSEKNGRPCQKAGRPVYCERVFFDPGTRPSARAAAKDCPALTENP